MLHIIALITKCKRLDFQCSGNATLTVQVQSNGRFDTCAGKFNKRAKIGKYVRKDGV